MGLGEFIHVYRQLGESSGRCSNLGNIFGGEAMFDI